MVDLHLGDAKLGADSVEGADEAGLPGLLVGAGVADEGIHGLNVIREAVGDAPHGVGENANGLDVLPKILTVDGRRREATPPRTRSR